MNTGTWVPQDFYDATRQAVKDRDPELLLRCCRWANIPSEQRTFIHMPTFEPMRQTMLLGTKAFFVVWELASEHPK